VIGSVKSYKAVYIHKKKLNIQLSVLLNILGNSTLETTMTIHYYVES
jgi:hypothetical protein